MSSLLACDIIVYNICESEEAIIEAAWAMQALHDSIPLFVQQKVFVCISTVLTWGRTKPLNPVSITNYVTVAMTTGVTVTTG